MTPTGGERTKTVPSPKGRCALTLTPTVTRLVAACQITLKRAKALAFLPRVNAWALAPEGSLVVDVRGDTG